MTSNPFSNENFTDFMDKYIQTAAQKISKNDVIPNELYIKHDVKRGLRNANGTGVVAQEMARRCRFCCLWLQYYVRNPWPGTAR